MPTLPLNGPKFRAFDANGDPLSGGKLYSYAAGTSTPLDTFTTRAGNIANTNPVVLDANGEADVWTTPGLLYKFVLADSADVIQWTVDNVPSGTVESTSADIASTIDPGGRLTLTTGTPATTSDVSGATTVFYVPYKHNKVPLYDGTTWTLHTIASELSQATSDTTKSPGAVGISTVYDIFVWDDAGTLRVSRGPGWSSDSSRGAGAGTTELQRVDGRYLNKYAISNGPAAQRGLYVGTIRSRLDMTLTDSKAIRYVWNAYNRLRRNFQVYESASTWVMSAPGTTRQANANTANQIDLVLGLDEEPVWAEVWAAAAPSGSSANATFGVGIGIDVLALSGSVLRPQAYSAGATQYETATALLNQLLGIGRHFLAWMEYSGATNTTTWGSGAGASQNGIFGHFMA